MQAVRTQEDFSKRVKHALIERGQTVTDLSNEMCYPRTTVSKAINSEKFPRLRERIARKLGITESL